MLHRTLWARRCHCRDESALPAGSAVRTIDGGEVCESHYCLAWPTDKAGPLSFFLARPSVCFGFLRLSGIDGVGVYSADDDSSFPAPW
jgi:hypothetical protein